MKPRIALLVIVSLVMAFASMPSSARMAPQQAVQRSVVPSAAVIGTWFNGRVSEVMAFPTIRKLEPGSAFPHIGRAFLWDSSAPLVPPSSTKRGVYLVIPSGENEGQALAYSAMLSSLTMAMASNLEVKVFADRRIIPAHPYYSVHFIEILGPDFTAEDDVSSTSPEALTAMGYDWMVQGRVVKVRHNKPGDDMCTAVIRTREGKRARVIVKNPVAEPPVVGREVRDHYDLCSLLVANMTSGEGASVIGKKVEGSNDIVVDQIDNRFCISECD